jgi:hypothetical protein
MLDASARERGTMDAYVDGLWLVRLLLQRGLACIYVIAFLVALDQGPALIGERGLLPIPAYVRRADWKKAPSIFFWRYSDGLFRAVAGVGLVLAIAALLGLSEEGPFWLSATIWLVMWAAYLSIVNVGQTFYAFGWESMLLEAGFFAAFLGPAHVEPSLVPILILRWMLFRTELGAGLIKLRHDRCWRDLTCLFYHYETQPLPNRASWYFHRLPRPAHRAAVAFSHFVQLVVPFGLFAPQPIAGIAGAVIVFHQLWLIVSGNYAWLNWLTVVLGIAALDHGMLAPLLPLAAPARESLSTVQQGVLYTLAGVTALLSVQPVLNLLSKDQAMNASYNPLHLVNTYGAFGSVTRDRVEIVLEGTDGDPLSDDATWREYELRAKPGDPRRAPRQVAPYHLRLDWLLWFLPFSLVPTAAGPKPARGHEVWLVRLVERLLEGDRATLRLLGRNPFPDAPPRAVRARIYRYRYTTWRERHDTGAWWHRELAGEYLPPVERAR